MLLTRSQNEDACSKLKPLAIVTLASFLELMQSLSVVCMTYHSHLLTFHLVIPFINNLAVAGLPEPRKE